MTKKKLIDQIEIFILEKDKRTTISQINRSKINESGRIYIYITQLKHTHNQQ